jgi:hypothetical protein
LAILSLEIQDEGEYFIILDSNLINMEIYLRDKKALVGGSSSGIGQL